MRKDHDEFEILKWLVIGAVVVGVIMGLIEWNARRQAAAITREMLRPATQEEQQQMDDAMARSFPEPDTYDQEIRRAVQREPEQTPARDSVAPLAPDERCISGQRFRRLPNGWSAEGVVPRNCP